MTIEEQLNAKLREGAEVEYKSAKGGFPQSFWSSFSAFANTNGGILVLGVKEKNGTFVPDGLTEDQVMRYRKKFWDDAHNKACVSIPLLLEGDVEEVQTDGGSYLLVFHIPRAAYNLRPVYLTLNPFGNTYRRRHEGDYACTDDEVRQMFSDANNLKSSADSRILRGYSISDIDLPTLQRYRRVYNIHHENHPWIEEDDMAFLEHIGAYRKDRAASMEGFTVAGMLMFGKTNSITDPECCPEFFPDYRERLGLDPRERWSNRVYPDGTWEANLYQFFTRVLPMLQQALPVPFRLDENLHRIDTTTAHTSVREAFANCIIHCAYTVMGNITVDRYFNKIVLSNPGTMLVSKEEFEEGGHSVCRNPLLQKMFVFIGVGEKGGSGADVIEKGWRDNGWERLPTIREVHHPDRVEMVLRLPEVTTLQEQPTITVRTDDKITEKLPINPTSSGKITEKLPINPTSGDKITDKLPINEKMNKIYRYIREHSHATSDMVANHIGLGKESAKKYLQRLVALGYVQPEGANKNRTYIALAQ